MDAEYYRSPFEMLENIRTMFGIELSLAKGAFTQDQLEATFDAYKIVDKVMDEFRTIKVG